MNTSELDPVDVLLAQHARIGGLFRQAHAARGEQRREVLTELVRLVAVHEIAEGEIVHPVARRCIPAGWLIVDARMAEEHDIRQALAELQDFDPADTQFAGVFRRLRRLVRVHVEREERHEFPPLRHRVSPVQQQAMARALLVAEQFAPTRPEPGGEPATAGSLIGPPLAVVDRVREAVRGALR